MALVKPETFDDKEVTMVYVVGRLSEGKRVEQILSAKAIDYAVDIEPYQSRLLGILPVKHEGIGFYVLSAQVDFCRRVLREAGLVQGLVEEDRD
ncbi:MAG: hypothetical protein GEU77_07755 [Deltaproteobacteria bacterium]|jgi:hypothetical protein|nr:hypothetical protein [Deltaproteobacteria bacterium]